MRASAASSSSGDNVARIERARPPLVPLRKDLILRRNSKRPPQALAFKPRKSCIEDARTSEFSFFKQRRLDPLVQKNGKPPKENAIATPRIDESLGKTLEPLQHEAPRENTSEASASEPESPQNPEEAPEEVLDRLSSDAADCENYKDVFASIKTRLQLLARENGITAMSPALLRRLEVFDSKFSLKADHDNERKNKSLHESSRALNSENLERMDLDFPAEVQHRESPCSSALLGEGSLETRERVPLSFGSFRSSLDLEDKDLGRYSPGLGAKQDLADEGELIQVADRNFRSRSSSPDFFQANARGRSFLHFEGRDRFSLSPSSLRSERWLSPKASSSPVSGLCISTMSPVLDVESCLGEGEGFNEHDSRQQQQQQQEDGLDMQQNFFTDALSNESSRLQEFFRGAHSNEISRLQDFFRGAHRNESSRLQDFFRGAHSNESSRLQDLSSDDMSSQGYRQQDLVGTKELLDTVSCGLDFHRDTESYRQKQREGLFWDDFSAESSEKQQQAILGSLLSTESQQQQQGFLQTARQEQEFLQTGRQQQQGFRRVDFNTDDDFNW